MATIFSVNQSPSTGAIAMYQLIAAMLSGGWVQKGSGDATTFSNSAAGPVTNGGTGASGLGNNAAWVRLQMPALSFAGVSSNRELLIQRGNSDINWWIRYSPTLNFTGSAGGAISATVAPTAVDQVNILGTAQAGTTIFSTNNTYRCNCMAYDGTNSYGFYLFTFVNGGGNVAKAAFVMDPMTSASSGDKDPYLFYAAGPSTAVFSGQGSNDFRSDTGNILGFLSTNITASSNFVLIQSNTYYQPQVAVTIIPSGLSVDPFGNQDHVWPIFFSRRSNMSQPVGPKGYGTIMKFTGVARNIGDTISTTASGSADYIVVTDIALPWNGSTPTV